MLTKEDIKKAIEFDDAAAEAGDYLDTDYTPPSYRIRDMHRWAAPHGKDVEKLTPAEREPFMVKLKQRGCLKIGFLTYKRHPLLV